jgi:hypothetical protein
MYIPKQNDAITLAGRDGRFLVIGIDSINKTVEVRTMSNPVAIVKDVPWTTLCLDPTLTLLLSDLGPTEQLKGVGFFPSS